MNASTGLTVSYSPHIRAEEDIPRLMYGVLLALIPSAAVAVGVFGPAALRVILTASVTAVLCEYLIQRFVLKTPPTIGDGSALLTGVLLALNLPSGLPTGLVVLGTVIAVGLAKMTFGGLGNNIFNPALVGRVFLLISFPVEMTRWPLPFAYRGGVDAATGPTPLGLVKEALKSGESLSDAAARLPSIMDLVLGKVGGSIGEVSAAAVLLGFFYMWRRGIVSWHIPVAMVGSAAALSGALHLASPDRFAGPLFHVFTGGLLFGAVFMATDMVTSPMTPKGMLIFGSGIGILTVVIRVFGAYPEGVSFAILIMNAFVPLIDRFCKPAVYGLPRGGRHG